MEHIKEEEQLAIFDGFGAYVIARDCIQNGYLFCDAAQVKFFILEPEIAVELALLHLSKGFPLCDAAQREVFKLSGEQAERIVLMELEQGFALCDDTLGQVAKLPLGTVILENYYLSSDRIFSSVAQKFLLETPALRPIVSNFIHMNKKAPNRLGQELRDYAKAHGFIRSSVRQAS